MSLSLFSLPVLAKGVYQSNDAFLQSAFQNNVPKTNVIWQKGIVRKNITTILGQRYPSLRIKYWANNDKSAWILQQIGKDKPITIGLVVQAGKIKTLKILAFRESRGDEVRYAYFTNQFKAITLNNEQKLSHSIDAITGATLSVRAVKRAVKLALYLDQYRLSQL